VRLYDRLFQIPNPAAEEDFRAHLNPGSVEIVKDALIEPSLAQAEAGANYQFERLGYFCADITEHQCAAPVFNRTVTLRDTWAKSKK
jgi:glutaminyl-tRNA synthetase